MARLRPISLEVGRLAQAKPAGRATSIEMERRTIAELNGFHVMSNVLQRIPVVATGFLLMSAFVPTAGQAQLKDAPKPRCSVGIAAISIVGDGMERYARVKIQNHSCTATCAIEVGVTMRETTGSLSGQWLEGNMRSIALPEPGDVSPWTYFPFVGTGAGATRFQAFVHSCDKSDCDAIGIDPKPGELSASGLSNFGEP